MIRAFLVFWGKAARHGLKEGFHLGHVVHWALSILLVLLSGVGFGAEEHDLPWLKWIPVGFLGAYAVLGAMYQAFRLSRDEGEIARLKARIRESEEQVAGLTAELTRQQKIIIMYEEQVARIIRHYEKHNHKKFPVVLLQQAELTVDGNGDGYFLETRKLRAPAGRVQHFLIDKLADPSGPAFGIHALDFRLTVHSGHEVVFLPARTHANAFPILLLFLPPLDGTTPDLHFSIAWRWPKAWAGLLDPVRKKEEYLTLVNSEQDVPAIRYVFYVHESIPLLPLVDAGTHPGTQIAAQPNLAKPEYRTYIWEATNVPPEKTVAATLARA